MEKLHIARNLFDFGIVIVVWLAQAIMYPSLAHIERDAFVSWHRKYSSRIAVFVIAVGVDRADRSDTAGSSPGAT